MRSKTTILQDLNGLMVSCWSMSPSAHWSFIPRPTQRQCNHNSLRGCKGWVITVSLLCVWPCDYAPVWCFGLADYLSAGFVYLPQTHTRTQIITQQQTISHWAGHYTVARAILLCKGNTHTHTHTHKWNQAGSGTYCLLRECIRRT